MEEKEILRSWAYIVHNGKTHGYWDGRLRDCANNMARANTSAPGRFIRNKWTW
jgi:hypothetical protein